MARLAFTLAEVPVVEHQRGDAAVREMGRMCREAIHRSAESVGEDEHGTGRSSLPPGRYR